MTKFRQICHTACQSFYFPFAVNVFSAILILLNEGFISVLPNTLSDRILQTKKIPEPIERLTKLWRAFNVLIRWLQI